jgi:Flp pilus assembly protein TadG
MITSRIPRYRDQLRRDEGSVLVEAGMTIPILLLLVLGTVQMSIAFWQWNTMVLATEEAGRCAMINAKATTPQCKPASVTCSTVTGCAQAHMQAVISNFGTSATNVAVCTTPSAGHMCVNTTTTAGTPQTMTLTARYNFNLLAITAPFTITSQITVPLI